MNTQMRELTFEEIQHVEGAGGADLGFSIASSWASTVTGGAAGYIIGNGVRGALMGGAIGFGVGALIGVGFYLARN